ncbi:MAG: hypothetical protein SFY69_06125 [Planctomycetota bacterium]|nr:hypothetical protein [Planctomycetota bacterium]
MLVISPQYVTFAGVRWAGVRSVAVDRHAARAVVEGGDGGRYATFADTPEVRVTITVVLELEASDLAGPRPGEQGTLEFSAAAGASDVGRRVVRATCVVLRAVHEVRGAGATRTVTLAAVSTTGSADPVVVEVGGDEK